MEHITSTTRPEDCSVLDAIISRGIAFPHQRIPVQDLIVEFDIHAASGCTECLTIAQWEELHEGEEN